MAKRRLYRCRTAFRDDVEKRPDIQAGAAHEGSVYVGLAHKILGVFGFYAAPVDHVTGVGGLGAKPLSEATANVGMRLAGLGGGGGAAGADGPHRLVGDHELRELLTGEPLEPLLDLPIEHIHRF